MAGEEAVCGKCIYVSVYAIDHHSPQSPTRQPTNAPPEAEARGLGQLGGVLPQRELVREAEQHADGGGLALLGGGLGGRGGQLLWCGLS